MNYKSPDRNSTVPDSISLEELLKFWAMSQLAPGRKEIIASVLREFRQKESTED